MAKKEHVCGNCDVYKKLWEDEREKRMNAERFVTLAEADAASNYRMYEHSMKRESRLRRMIEDYAAKHGAQMERFRVSMKLLGVEIGDFLADEKASESSAAGK